VSHIERSVWRGSARLEQRREPSHVGYTCLVVNPARRRLACARRLPLAGLCALSAEQRLPCALRLRATCTASSALTEPTRVSKHSRARVRREWWGRPSRVRHRDDVDEYAFSKVDNTLTP